MLVVDNTPPLFLMETWPIEALELYREDEFPNINEQIRNMFPPGILMPNPMLEEMLKGLIHLPKASDVKGRLLVFKCRKHRPAGKNLVDPVFMMWGFDPSASQRDETYVREILAGREIRDPADPNWDKRHRDAWMCAETNGLLELLMANGRDVCMLIPDDATNMLQTTALLMLAALNKVFQESLEGTPVPVVGFSAGGIISRWALLHLEDKPEKCKRLYPHIGKISAYFSYDTPHYGANVPLSIQMFLNHLSSNWKTKDLFNNKTSAVEALKTINSPAACQLAWYHYGGTNPWGKHDVGPHSLRLELAGEIRDRWPQGIDRYAYANGPANWHLFSAALPDMPLIRFSTAINPGSGDLMDFKTLPDPNKPDGNDVFTLGPSFARDYWGWVNRAEPLDSAPGSKTGFYHQVIDALNSWSDNGGLADKILSLFVTYPLPDPPPSCFVPTVSALHLSTNVWYDCVHNLVGRDHMQPPFKRWQCAPDGVHERHVQVTDASARFVMSCIS